MRGSVSHTETLNITVFHKNDANLLSLLDALIYNKALEALYDGCVHWRVRSNQTYQLCARTVCQDIYTTIRQNLMKNLTTQASRILMEPSSNNMHQRQRSYYVRFFYTKVTSRYCLAHVKSAERERERDDQSARKSRHRKIQDRQNTIFVNSTAFVLFSLKRHDARYPFFQPQEYSIQLKILRLYVQLVLVKSTDE